ncbi:unnamed protein product, partial [Prunus brigantina]
MLDASAGGALVDKTPVAAKILIANRALNAQQYEGVGGRDHAQPSQVNEVVEGPKVQSAATCSVCSMHGHHTDQCPQLIANGGWESANAIVLTSLTQGLQNQAKEMSEVKKQIGQMAEFMGQFREEGKLPSSTIVNPKGGFETAKAII